MIKKVLLHLHSIFGTHEQSWANFGSLFLCNGTMACCCFLPVTPFGKSLLRISPQKTDVCLTPKLAQTNKERKGKKRKPRGRCCAALGVNYCFRMRYGSPFACSRIRTLLNQEPSSSRGAGEKDKWELNRQII